MLADRPEGAGVLDLFAGCGALGLEALSRGAAACVLVESSPDVLPTLRENVAALGLPGASVVAVDALEPHCYGAWAPYDLLLLDPPYRKGLGELALNAVAAGGLLASGGMAAMVHEAGGAPRAPAGWSVTRTRRHGDSAIALLEVPEGDE
jgi:16S rRNA (guanine966-N2)-methyltransferase